MALAGDGGGLFILPKLVDWLEVRSSHESLAVVEKSVSFRSILRSNSHDLLEGVGLNCSHTMQLISSLVSHLAAYTEEGVAMAPSIYICNSAVQLIGMVGVAENVLLCDETSTANAAERILKSAAPLSNGNWNIYVERLGDGSRCRYGIFSGSVDPTSLTVEEIVLGASDATFPVIRVVQTVRNKVEVRTSLSTAIEFRFNDDQDQNSLPQRTAIKLLSEAAGQRVEGSRVEFVGFLERLLDRAVSDSHGTLIAVVDNESIPDSLVDIVRFKEPVDLYERFRLHIDEGRTADSVGRLQLAAELVSGLVNSDGITVFSSNGKVLGFRAFVKSDVGSPSVSGGARTRAFAALRESVGKTLCAAFFRSQDGRTEVIGS